VLLPLLPRRRGLGRGGHLSRPSRGSREEPLLHTNLASPRFLGLIPCDLFCSCEANIVKRMGPARQFRRKQTKEESQLWQGQDVSPALNFDVSIPLEYTAWTFTVRWLGYRSSWTVSRTGCRSTTWPESSFWNVRGLCNCGFGIANGGIIAKGFCWKSGTRCTNEQGVCR